jgi:hypothetical protein
MECFVIMPFGNSQKDKDTTEKLDDIYNNWIKPTVEDIALPDNKKLTCHRGDKEHHPGDIIKHAINKLVNADIVIADLSGRNPNVFYELGVRHSAKNDTILISENIDDIPVDLQRLRAIAYDYKDANKIGFQNALRSAIISIINNPNEINNPVQEYMVEEAKKGRGTGFMRPGYARSQDPEFYIKIKELIPKSKKITLIGTGLNLLDQIYIKDQLLERAQNGEAEITVCLGNPFSPHVEDRLIEEEMRGNRPTVAREGMIRNTESLVDRLESLGNPVNFQLLLFDHYPTFATLIFDDTIYIYPYAYQVLGNSSPIFHLVKKDGDVFKFFRTNAEQIVSDAVLAKDVIQRYRKPVYTSNAWIGAAVYLIPEKTDLLYRLGSELLGYDIWRKEEIPADRFESIQQYVGSAREFGFHATVADALLFATESAVDRIEAELRVIAKDFSPFTLSDFELIDNLGERQHIVMRFQDQSGTLEALHHEMVKRVYGMAISSNYAMGGHGAVFDPDKMRDTLMLNRYGAPYILNHYQPHFTLLANPPKEQTRRKEVLQTLQDEMGRIPNKLLAHEIVLVTKTAGDSHWRVRERFPLAKR